MPIKPMRIVIAGGTGFLGSPLASGITGTTLYVDKGYHAMGGPPPPA